MNDRLRVARINKHELADFPPDWNTRDRGQYLRCLLECKGINTRKLYRVEYFPHRQCWLLTQEVDPVAAEHSPPATIEDDERFYLQSMAEFRRAASSAWAALARTSRHFASHGCHYQLPAMIQPMTPAALIQMLGGGLPEKMSIHFDSEGGWRHDPQAN
jgi:hypothetical protein